MATEFAVPGPWRNLRPLFSKFQLGKESYSADHAAVPQKESGTFPLSGAVPAFGELKSQDNYALQIKAKLTPVRPVLHALLLGLPTLFMAFVVGRKATLYAMLLLALMIEVSQFGFGYGFDAIDVADIIFDITGILIFLWLSRKIIDRLPISLRSSGFFRPSLN